jgi:uncharacterized protein (TIGR04255 family)
MALIRVEAPGRTFLRAPIALVACQINFEPILRLSEAEFVAPFQEALREQYPTVNRVGGIQFTLGGGGLSAEPADAGGWAFASSDGQWQIGLGRDNLTIQSAEYVSYEQLRDRFLAALRLFVDEYRPGARLRLGLRYINRFVFDEATTVDAWRKLVRAELLGLAGAPEIVNEEDVRQSFGQARIAREDSQMLVSYGFLEAATLTHPAVAAQALPHFLLDMDQFDLRRHDSIDLDRAQGELDEWHDDIHRLFRWALTEEGAARLEPQDKVDDPEASVGASHD